MELLRIEKYPIHRTWWYPCRRRAAGKWDVDVRDRWRSKATCQHHISSMVYRRKLKRTWIEPMRGAYLLDEVGEDNLDFFSLSHVRDKDTLVERVQKMLNFVHEALDDDTSEELFLARSHVYSALACVEEHQETHERRGWG